eukprot:CAMPEP_0174915650 /NCGR_PEP_ID=MMETSP1355-20121228/1250_1 /TAXON_ID=464990 /ORGANISM="Hemiselmis tepida, Strain CCMP443" /LENGTH=275 /DNA_ID=CAMNT_0016160567 /DNA_START=55 /DNA_END=879 /DNA_ORIENTATION=-
MGQQGSKGSSAGDVAWTDSTDMVSLCKPNRTLQQRQAIISAENELSHCHTDIARLHAMAQISLDGNKGARKRFVLELCQLKTPFLVLKKLTPTQREATLKACWEVHEMVQAIKVGDQENAFWKGYSTVGQANIRCTLTPEGIRELEKAVKYMTVRRITSSDATQRPHHYQRRYENKYHTTTTTTIGGKPDKTGEPVLDPSEYEKKREALLRRDSFKSSTGSVGSGHSSSFRSNSGGSFRGLSGSGGSSSRNFKLQDPAPDSGGSGSFGRLSGSGG